MATQEEFIDVLKEQQQTDYIKSILSGKINGKGLSEANFTLAEKAKLAFFLATKTFDADIISANLKALGDRVIGVSFTPGVPNAPTDWEKKDHIAVATDIAIEGDQTLPQTQPEMMTDKRLITIKNAFLIEAALKDYVDNGGYLTTGKDLPAKGDLFLRTHRVRKKTVTLTGKVLFDWNKHALEIAIQRDDGTTGNPYQLELRKFDHSIPGVMAAPIYAKDSGVKSLAWLTHNGVTDHKHGYLDITLRGDTKRYTITKYGSGSQSAYKLNNKNNLDSWLATGKKDDVITIESPLLVGDDVQEYMPTLYVKKNGKFEEFRDPAYMPALDKDNPTMKMQVSNTGLAAQMQVIYQGHDRATMGWVAKTGEFTFTLSNSAGVQTAYFEIKPDGNAYIGGNQVATTNGTEKMIREFRTTVQHDIADYAKPTRAECIDAFKHLPHFDWTKDDDFYIKDTSGSKMVLLKYRAGTATDEATAGEFYYEILSTAV